MQHEMPRVKPRGFNTLSYICSNQGLTTLGKQRVCDSVDVFINNEEVTLLDAHPLKPRGFKPVFILGMRCENPRGFFGLIAC